MCANGGGDGIPLVDVVRRAKSGRASPHDVFDAFLQARVYCERPDTPGFLTVPAPPETTTGNGTRPRSRIADLLDEPSPPPLRLVPVFSSLEQLALFTGGGAWFSTTGEDVLVLLPEGHDVWLDPAAAHAVRLSSAATGVSPVLTISYRPGGQPV